MKRMARGWWVTYQYANLEPLHIHPVHQELRAIRRQPLQVLAAVEAADIVEPVNPEQFAGVGGVREFCLTYTHLTTKSVNVCHLFMTT
jgi:hypothetical protein